MSVLTPQLPAIVLDTNIVLDLFVFDDPRTPALQAALDSGGLRWLATSAMREELARVLAYPQIAKRLQFYQLSAEAVLQRFDAGVQLVEVAARAPNVCKDPDDQKFIDLAVAHHAILLSKDDAVLCMKKRLAVHGVQVAQVLPTQAT